MNAKKPSRRKPSANKLEPIDWREFANDAVLNGNMSTLFRRPPNEDATAYASPEAMVEIEKRIVRPQASTAELEPPVPSAPTVGNQPIDSALPAAEPLPMDPVPTVGPKPTANQTRPTVSSTPTEGLTPTVGFAPRDSLPSGSPAAISPVGPKPTVGIATRAHSVAHPEIIPTVGPVARSAAPVGSTPTVGKPPQLKNRKVKPVRNVQDALTLAGQVLYRAMLGSSETAWSISCTKGYRQLAAETHLDKDTVRDLIVEFKEKGIVRETATYDADTRMSKTYEVLSNHAVLQLWREAGVFFVTAGRQRPLFCSDQGELLVFTPTVGQKPTVGG